MLLFCLQKVHVSVGQKSRIQHHNGPESTLSQFCEQTNLADFLIAYLNRRNASAWSKKARTGNLKEFNAIYNYLMENKLYSVEELEKRLEDEAPTTEENPEDLELAGSEEVAATSSSPAMRLVSTVTEQHSYIYASGRPDAGDSRGDL